MSVEPVLSKIDESISESIERLMELLRIPSVSTDPAYAENCKKAADWLAKDLRSIGFDASTRECPGHPMVVGHAGSSGPHVMFYGHYDVQPVDPLELWTRNPFDPALEKVGGRDVIRARGSSDDKGQLMTFVEACRAWKATHGSLPGRISVFLEGEEECGSPSLIPFMEENAKELKADIALICDTGLFGDTPAIVTMLRGLVGEEVTITGPDKDLHSGMYGGIAMNPIRVLSKVIASLHDDSGRITIPGFYDGVDELPDSVRKQWEGLGFSHSGFLGEVGLGEPAGERGRTPLEMVWSRPTCEANGICGGYTGEGFKTVLPSKASAKISFRLVGRQDPDAVRTAFREHVRSMLPKDCSAEFERFGTGPASQMSIDSPAFEKARQALTEEWSKPAAYVGCGGSIPIAGYFKTILDMDALLVGFGRDDDQIHSPNEKYDVESFHKGIRSWARILAKLNG